jgi:hypothetical protein
MLACSTGTSVARDGISQSRMTQSNTTPLVALASVRARNYATNDTVTADSTNDTVTADRLMASGFFMRSGNGRVKTKAE